jgi:methylase of polypeptide subunit release factors
VLTKEEINTFMKSYGALMRERTYAIQDLDQMPAFHQHANAKSRLQLLEQKLKEITERRAQTLNALEQRKQAARDQLKTLAEESGIKLF